MFSSTIYYGKKLTFLNSAPAAAFVLAVLLTIINRPSPKEQAYRIISSGENNKYDDLQTFNNVLLRLKEDYLDESRLKPDKMFVAAVSELEKNIPELTVRIKNNLLEISVENIKKTYDLSKIKNFLALYRNIHSIFQTISKITPQNKIPDLEETAINGMLSVLDPHTLLLGPEVYREMKTGTQGFFSGIGIVVTYENDKLLVISPIDDTPAAKAGIKPGDKIVKINSHLTSGMSLNKAVNMLRGKPGTKITVWIERKQVPHLLKFELIRTTIRLSSVTSRILQGNIGYIRIKQFTQTTTDELSKIIIHMKSKHIKGIILDLYNNPGGLLKEAGKSADLFIDHGIIYSIVTKHNKIEAIRKANPSETIWTGNLIVLINGGSASASEIMSGALKHNNRALILGEKSFGKGSIQEISENDDGSALKMTIAHYLSAGKYAIQSIGVNPQITVQYIDMNKHYQSFYWLINQKKEKKNAIPLTIGQKDFPPWMNINLFSREDENSEQNQNQAPQALIGLARDFCLYSGKSALYMDSEHRKQIINWFKKRSEEEMRWFVESLGKQGIDWSLSEKNTGKPILEYSVKFSPENEIKAPDTLHGVITVRNLGTGAVSRLRALIQNKPDENPLDILFGKINPGEQKAKKFKFFVPSDTPNSVWPFTIRLLSDDPLFGKNIKIIRKKQPLIHIKEALKPTFYVNYHMMDNIGGNGDGFCQKGEKIRFRIMVSNTGKGAGKEVSLKMRLLGIKNNEITRNQFFLGVLESGETVTRDVFISVPADYNSPRLILDLSVEDQLYKIKTQEIIHYPISKKKHPVINTTGLFKLKKDADIYDIPDMNAFPIGVTPKYSIFPIESRFAGWIKIRINPERTAFLLRTDGNSTDLNESALPKPIWKPVYQIIPPAISVKSKSENCIVDLKFSIFHPTTIRDTYIELFAGKNIYKKLFFVKSKTNKIKELHRVIKIKPNVLNKIIIRARSTKKLQSDYTQIFFCKKSD